MASRETYVSFKRERGCFLKLRISVNIAFYSVPRKINAYPHRTGKGWLNTSARVLAAFKAAKRDRKRTETDGKRSWYYARSDVLMPVTMKVTVF
jgi:hypothetical protein